MRFYADLHIHSKYSRACSRDCDLEHLTWWARRKGIGLVGTGDFTHPAWFEHLQDMLVPAEPGVFQLRDDVDQVVNRTLPAVCRTPVRFMLSVEISTIYKRDDRTRKVHHLIYLPDFDSVRRFNTALGKIGNLGSDGRPILGLDSRDLLEITLESSPDGYLVPAHVWTPWFSAMGSKSGFDAIADCYVDLADHIFAIETGLSSDPAMNWRVSSLDKYRLVSNSDAHSPPMLAREATVFDTELNYYSIRDSLRTGDGFAGTVEFFPEEGKYHVDGHRKCDVRLEPAETKRLNGLCPECKKPVTVGVLSRVDELADRDESAGKPASAADFRNLVPLPEMMGEILKVGPKSKKVRSHIDALVAEFGPELSILSDVPPEDIAQAGQPLLAEAVTRLRRGEVIREAGYDGEYGVIRVFKPGEIEKSGGVPVLFEVEPSVTAKPAKQKQTAIAVPTEANEEPAETEKLPATAEDSAPVLSGLEEISMGLLDSLDPDQRLAAAAEPGPLLIVAGPGTGKTRTLTHRLADFVVNRGIPADQCLAITFTRRAAAEMQERLEALLSDVSGRPTVTTFHGLGSQILREQHDYFGLTANFEIADRAASVEILEKVVGSAQTARRLAAQLFDSRRVDDIPAEHRDVADQYHKAMRAANLVDFDDLILLPLELLSENPEIAGQYQKRFQHIAVDEYQDVDAQQYQLLQLLTGPNQSICAIGDPDQSIYSFRGSDVGFFLAFQNDYPQATVVQLTRNYRSSATIVAGALQAIAPATLVPDRQLQPARREQAEAAPISLFQASTEMTEADFVARTIDQLLGGSSFHSRDSGRVDADGLINLSFSDIAILYRTNQQAGPIMQALTKAGMPFQKRSHDRLSDRPGVPELARELHFADTAGGTVLDRLRRSSAIAIDRLSTLDSLVAGDQSEADFHAALELLTPLAQRCGDNVEQFLTELALGAEVDTWDQRADRISLLTLHAAKGLEFPVVFLVGCEDGLLPLRWSAKESTKDAADPTDSGPDQAQEAEERRLFFVGITRAQSHLYLSHAQERSWRGANKQRKRSEFLAALDESLLHRIGDNRSARRPKERQLRLL